jgi:hypothetical protein
VRGGRQRECARGAVGDDDVLFIAAGVTPKIEKSRSVLRGYFQNVSEISGKIPEFSECFRSFSKFGEILEI